jgi:Ssp1 endopeptidase immunity protein Rap1a
VASWRSGDALVCKTRYSGSIPDEASIIFAAISWEGWGCDLALAVVVVALSATVSNAQTSVDGNKLLEWCENKPSYFCIGYIAGVSDTLAYTASPDKNDPLLVCIPPKTQLRALYDVVLKGLRDNPQQRTWPGFVLASAYLRRAWPCPGQTPNEKLKDLFKGKS